jgi:predicted Zn-ribbon and HTH transcriptional regulator
MNIFKILFPKRYQELLDLNRDIINLKKDNDEMLYMLDKKCRNCDLKQESLKKK